MTPSSSRRRSLPARTARPQTQPALRGSNREIVPGGDRFRLGEGGEGLDFDEGFADSSQVAAEQGEVRAIVGNLRALLNDVERALAKIDDGTYGLCETCREPIAPARLEAMPASRYCVQHA